VGTVRWKDAIGGSYGPLNDHAATRVIAPRKLAVVKSGFLTTAADGSQSIDYELAITNLGDQSVTNTVLNDTPDGLTAIVAGSVTTNLGSVTRGNEADATDIEIALGTLAGRSTAVVSFSVDVTSVPEGVVSVTNQATVTSAELPSIVSDDPEAPGAADPTITPVGPTAGSGGGGGGEAKPTIAAPTPADGTVVTEPTTISVGITPPEGQAVASWKITATRAGTTDEVTLATGTGGDVDEAITASAAFDPTTLPNGTYLITVRSTASGAGVSLSISSLIVDGYLKLGRYVVSYQDLSVAVAGVPMQVRRTYDSFDKAKGDFGVGWRLELANLRVSVNRPLGLSGWTRQAINCGFIFCQLRYSSTVPHFATVTWPDGHQEIFDFQPQDGSTFFAPLTAAGFKPRPRVTSKLEVDGDNSLTFLGDGNLYGGAFGTGGVFDAQRFRLTARDGTVYLLDRTAGLISATDRLGNTLTVSSTGVTSSLGPSITFTRDPQGRITKITGPSNETHDYTYDARGDLVRVIDKELRDTTFSYDSDHNLTGVTGDDNRPFRTLTYGPDGRLTTITDGEHNASQIESDVEARTELVTDATTRLTTLTTFDAFGQVIRVDRAFDGQTQTVRYGYDANGNTNHVIDPRNGDLFVDYNAAGRPVRVENDLGRVTRFEYDPAGELVRVFGPGDIRQIEITRDPIENPTRIDRGGGNVTDYTYGPDGRLATATDALTRTLHFGYNAAGNLTSVEDDGGLTTTATYDASNRLLTTRDHLGGVTSYTYDSDGNITQVTDPNTHAWTYTYDEQGRLLSERDPLLKTRTYTYDAAGRLVARKDRLNQTTTYEYDAVGRLTKVNWPDTSSTTFAHDGLGRLTHAENADATVDLGYNLSDLVTSIATHGQSGSGLPTTSVTYGYDSLGNRTSMVSAAGATAYQYDDFDQLSSLDDPTLGLFGFHYDGLGHPTAIERPNGVDTAFTWDAAGQLNSIIHSGPGGVVDSTAYTYNDSGRRVSLTDPAGLHQFTYDGAGRLLTADHPAPQIDESYAYDAADNRTSFGSVHDVADRLTQNTAFTYVHDAEGRMLSRTDRVSGAQTRFAWRPDGLLKSVTAPGSAVTTFRYDPLGRRIAVDGPGVAIRYGLGADKNVLYQYDAAGSVTARFTTGLGIDQLLAISAPAGVAYYLQDATNNVTALTAPNGSVIERYTYGTFGQPRSSGGSFPNPFTFSGRPFEPVSGTYDLRARAYDPSIGQFLSEDPAPAVNPYPYALNNPVTFLDPLGAQPMAEYGSLEERNAAVAARVQQVAQEGANLGRDRLLQYLTQAERDALLKEPWLEKMYMGQAVHRYTATILEQEGYLYHLIGPDFEMIFADGSVFVELTTPLQVAAHIARGGLYEIAQIMTYLLP
jgi:RHS repeat-associated protein/uncharacterized repeat protein (TIGR01451 family)